MSTQDDDRVVDGDDGDDGGVLDDISEVVEVVLSDDLGPDAPEDPWERRQRLLDSWTAIILAVAAIVAAWGSFQASQWGGAQSDAQSKSAIARAESGRFATEATQDTVIDSQMWLSWLDAVNAQDSRKAGFLDQRFSPWLTRAQDEWLSGVKVDANGTPVVVPAGTPLDLPSYVVPAQLRSDANSAYAEAQLAYGDKAGSISTSYVLLAVLVALVLFFGSVALKFTNPRAQVGLTLAALLLLVLSTVRMFLLPQYLWGRPDPEPVKESYVSATQ